MTKIEYCRSGMAKTGLELGFITPHVYAYYERFELYQLTREQGNGHIKSIDIVAKLTKSSRATVRRAVKFFE